MSWASASTILILRIPHILIQSHFVEFRRLCARSLFQFELIYGVAMSMKFPVNWLLNFRSLIYSLKVEGTHCSHSQSIWMFHFMPIGKLVCQRNRSPLSIVLFLLLNNIWCFSLPICMRYLVLSKNQCNTGNLALFSLEFVFFSFKLYLSMCESYAFRQLCHASKCRHFARLHNTQRNALYPRAHPCSIYLLEHV